MTTSETQKKQWLSVMALAVGALIFNTTEYIPIALLSDIGKSFNTPPTGVDAMITVYAWIVALLPLSLMLATKSFGRRRLPLVLFALFTASHAVSFLAWNLEILLLSRIEIAPMHAVFWSIMASLAVHVASQGKGSQVLGPLSTGTVVAMIIGIPLGCVIGQYFSWQVNFLFTRVCMAAVMMILAKNLPLPPSRNSGSLSSLPVLLKHKNLMMSYVLTVLVIMACFTAYNYVEPPMLQTGGFRSEQVTLILGLYGLAGFSASYVFGRWFAKFPRRSLAGSVGVTMSATLPLLPLAGYAPAVYVLCFIQGMAIPIASSGMMSKVLNLTSDATDVASLIYLGLYNVGIGGGALLGRYVTVWFGLNTIGVAEVLLAAAALWLRWPLVGHGDLMEKIESDKGQVPV